MSRFAFFVYPSLFGLLCQLLSGVKPLSKAGVLVSRLQNAHNAARKIAPARVNLPVPSGLPKVIHPKDNLPSKAKIALGKMLYFDGRLSSDNKVSCASCHDPAKGWSNGEAVAEGVGGLKGGRNSPTTLNTAYQTSQFWDGRNKTLEEQALGPIQSPIEMNMPLDKVVERLNAQFPVTKKRSKTCLEQM